MITSTERRPGVNAYRGDERGGLALTVVTCVPRERRSIRKKLKIM